MYLLFIINIPRDVVCAHNCKREPTMGDLATFVLLLFVENVTQSLFVPNGVHQRRSAMLATTRTRRQSVGQRRDTLGRYFSFQPRNDRCSEDEQIDDRPLMLQRQKENGCQFFFCYLVG